ncbi:hypothetical protein Tco_1164279 [Tanacetum coccineum]
MHFDPRMPQKDKFIVPPLPPLEKLTGAEPVSRPKTVKSILKSKSTFKAVTLKGIIINEPSSAPARGNKSSLVSKNNSAPAGKLKNVKIEDDSPLAIVMKELNELKLQISKNKSSYFKNKNSQQYHPDQGESSSRSRPARPAIPFPSCIHCGYNDHKSNDYVYYPICEICRSYDHDTHGHDRIISLRRGIKPRNTQHVTNNCETCSSNVQHLITMTLSGSGKEKLFKLRKLSLSNQIKQSERGISINKEKDVNDLLRMYDKIDSSVNTPIMPPKMLGPDLNGNAVNESQNRGMIGPLVNLTTSRPNIIFSTAQCKTPSEHKESHLISVQNFQVSKCKSTSDACQLLEGKPGC